MTQISSVLDGVRGPVTLAMILISPGLATAEDKIVYSGGVTASSALFDRGEQIGGPTLEFSAGAEVPLGDVTAYGGFYRLLPVGADQEAFDDEADYTLGVVLEEGAVSADLSANWLTYPGEAADPSLELVGAFGFDAPLSPSVTAFYDADLDDRGLELAVQPSREVGDWTLYTLARAGFVEPGDGSPNRSYIGAEVGASRPVLEKAEFGIYARAEAADAESYADEIDAGRVSRTGNGGVAFGVSLSFAG